MAFTSEKTGLHYNLHLLTGLEKYMGLKVKIYHGHTHTANIQSFNKEKNVDVFVNINEQYVGYSSFPSDAKEFLNGNERN